MEAACGECAGLLHNALLSQAVLCCAGPEFKNDVDPKCSVCVCVCVCARARVCALVSVCAGVCTSVCACARARVRACVCLCLCVRVRVRVCVCVVCECVWVLEFPFVHLSCVYTCLFVVNERLHMKCHTAVTLGITDNMWCLLPRGRSNCGSRLLQNVLSCGRCTWVTLARPWLL